MHEASSRKKASLGKMKMFIYHSYCYCSAPETIYSRHRLVTKKDESTMKKNEYRKHNKIFFHFMKNGLHHMYAILLCCYEHVSYTCTIHIFKLIFLFTTKLHGCCKNFWQYYDYLDYVSMFIFPYSTYIVFIKFLYNGNNNVVYWKQN